MTQKLGFTFYPKDWWTSESFFEFSVEERYIYLECLFIMYLNDGMLKTQKTQLENRLRTQISDEVFAKVTSRFILMGDFFTHPSVNKRLRKTLANRQNGKKGGRPEKPKKPNFENPEKPTLEREREREREYKNIFRKPTVEEIKNYCKEKNSSVDAEKFFWYYESKGWKVGKSPMKNWKAAISTWEKNSDRSEKIQLTNSKPAKELK